MPSQWPQPEEVTPQRGHGRLLEAALPVQDWLTTVQTMFKSGSSQSENIAACGEKHGLHVSYSQSEHTVDVAGALLATAALFSTCKTTSSSSASMPSVTWPGAAVARSVTCIQTKQITVLAPGGFLPRVVGDPGPGSSSPDCEGGAGVCRGSCRYLSLFRMSTSVQDGRLHGLATDHRVVSAASMARTAQGLAVAVSGAARSQSKCAADSPWLSTTVPGTTSSSTESVSRSRPRRRAFAEYDEQESRFPGVACTPRVADELRMKAPAPAV